MEVKQGTFKIHPYARYKITRQPFYFSYNVCNQHSHMWGEEVNSKFQRTNLSWINKHSKMKMLKTRVIFKDVGRKICEFSPLYFQLEGYIL
jgi:hypothetical protein